MPTFEPEKADLGYFVEILAVFEDFFVNFTIYRSSYLGKMLIDKRVFSWYNISYENCERQNDCVFRKNDFSEDFTFDAKRR